MNKEKTTKILIIAMLTILILLVVITSIILHQKQKKLDDLNNKNEIVKPDPTPEIEENIILDPQRNIIKILIN